jgi:ParB family chromosome partitioning protein
MTLQDLQTVDIPLNKLVLWDENVRTTGAEDGLDELIASITSVGLLHSLVVQKATRGQYSVIAGKRRFLALSQMAASGNVKRTMPVPCRVAAQDADLTEISLAENVVRLEMCPVSELEAWLRMIQSGHCVAEIAARFGVTEAVVNRRLALARVSPVLLELYRANEIDLDVLQAFTLTDNHATQEQVWNDLQEWDRNPQAIRHLLSNEDIPATDKRAMFVGLPAYEAAGGVVKRDLFSEDEEGAYITDAPLLTRLVNAKLQTLATQANADGWKWVEVQPQTDHQALGKFRRIRATPAPLPPEDATRIEELEQKLTEIADHMENDSDADSDALDEQAEEIQTQIAAIQEQQVPSFPADTKASCGVVVTVGHNGEAQLIYGLLRKEDAAQLTADHTNEDATTVEPTTEHPQPYSAVLVETLTVVKTAAIAAELSQQPAIALAAAVHALVLSQFGLDLKLYGTRGSIQISTTQPNLSEAGTSKAVQSLEEQRDAWFARFPKTPHALFAWCLAQDQQTLLALLAFCTAISLNAVKTKNDPGASRLQHADALATALNMDMRNWFTPTAENFFSKVSKTRILEAMTDAGKAPNSNAPAQLKKSALAELAEKAITGTGWLPEPVRIQDAVKEVEETEELAVD